MSMVFRPDLKADWRGAADFLDREGTGGIVAVVSADPTKNVEYLAARYYLEPRWTAVSCPDHLAELEAGQSIVWVSIGLRDGQPVGRLPADLAAADIVQETRNFPGLRLMRVKLDQPRSGRDAVDRSHDREPDERKR